MIYGTAMLLMVLLMIALETLDTETKLYFVREGGPIELLSATGYFICILLMLFQGQKGLGHLSYWSVTLMLLFLGLRELDFHCRFTTMGITKTKFFVSPDVPLTEKIIGAAVLLLFLLTAFYLVKQHYRDIWNSLRKRSSWAIGLCLGIVLIFTSKFLDNQADLVEMLLGLIGIEWNPISVTVEEVAELNIPVMFMLAIMTGHSNSHVKPDS